MNPLQRAGIWIRNAFRLRGSVAASGETKSSAQSAVLGVERQRPNDNQHTIRPGLQPLPEKERRLILYYAEKLMYRGVPEPRRLIMIDRMIATLSYKLRQETDPDRPPSAAAAMAIPQPPRRTYVVGTDGAGTRPSEPIDFTTVR